jgi:hypothetical protein
LKDEAERQVDAFIDALTPDRTSAQSERSTKR